MSGLIALEFNEVSRDVLERLVAKGRLPNFARLLKSHALLPTTVSESYEKLEPWIQWVTAHTGKTQAEHGAFNLSDVQHTKLEQIWDVLERRGVPCGLVSPMNARRGALTKGFFIPDPWTTSKDTYPPEADSIFQFLAEKVQSHNVSLERGSSKLGFALACLRLGVPLPAMVRLGAAYVRTRLDRKNKWKLPAELDRFLFSMMLALRAKYRTQYTSIFMNSVAHYQHHYWNVHDAGYWSKRFPALFKLRNPVAETNLHEGDDPIDYGMKVMDEVLGRAIDAVGTESVMVLTGLSQLPFEGYRGGTGFYLYRPIDHAALFGALGIEIDRIAPLMSRDAMLYFADEAQKATALRKLRTATVRGEPLFLCTDETEQRLFVKVIYSFDAQQEATIDGEDVVPGSIKFHDHLLLITFKTGHHSPEGMLIAPRSAVPALPAGESLPLQEVPAIIFRAMRLEDSERLARELVLSPA